MTIPVEVIVLLVGALFTLCGLVVQLMILVALNKVKTELSLFKKDVDSRFQQVEGKGKTHEFRNRTQGHCGSAG